MVKIFRAALLLLCMLGATPAAAQTFPVPSDILSAGHWGSDGWDEQPVTYEAGSTPNVITNGASANIPATAYEFPDTNVISTTGWVVSTTSSCLTTYEGGSCPEAKVRFGISGFSHALKDDPIRNFNQPGTSHLHCFFGNATTNAVTTYYSLRKNALKSRSSGGPMNATAYWVPCLTKKIGGVDYVVKTKGILIYYELDPVVADQATWLLLGLRYVTGYEMDDQWAWLQTKIDVANAQPGTSGRYTLTGPGGMKAWLAQWKCDGFTSTIDGGYSFAGPAGEDAFSGQCSTGEDFWIQFRGNSCWDRVNFWSPGGYKHVIPPVYDTYLSTWTCPKNFTLIPDLQFQIHYPQEGIADRALMKLSSDGTNQHGITFHTDWLGAWQKDRLRDWLNNCIGIQNVAPSRECATASITNSTKLIHDTTSPLGRSPMVQFPPTSTTDTTKMWRWNGPIADTIHVHGN